MLLNLKQYTNTIFAKEDSLGAPKCSAGACAVLLLLLSMNGALTPVRAEVLRGGVEQDDELMRLKRPVNNGDATSGNDSLRIERGVPTAPPRSSFQGLVDTSSFSKPLVGNANQQQDDSGVVQKGQFGTIPANQFDLGADRNSKELVLAWERWHHQISQAIYTRWSHYADVPGHAVVKLIVTRDRNLQAQMIRSSGNPEFDRTLLEAIYTLSGNPGLTFPSQSERKAVTLESDYIAGSNVDPGFSWVRNDYEKVRQDY